MPAQAPWADVGPPQQMAGRRQQTPNPQADQRARSSGGKAGRSQQGERADRRRRRGRSQQGERAVAGADAAEATLQRWL
eukprot:4700554-Pyramimonas_sp.AAC.1